MGAACACFVWLNWQGSCRKGAKFNISMRHAVTPPKKKPKKKKKLQILLEVHPQFVFRPKAKIHPELGKGLYEGIF